MAIIYVSGGSFSFLFFVLTKSFLSEADYLSIINKVPSEVELDSIQPGRSLYFLKSILRGRGHHLNTVYAHFVTTLMEQKFLSCSHAPDVERSD